MMLDRAAFEASLDGPAPPAGAEGAIAALWWVRKGDWDRAHQHAQADRSARGAAVHAYLHRVEGDLANARYWYGRAGRTPRTGPPEEEWAALADELIGN